jgi:hypothetical protein
MLFWLVVALCQNGKTHVDNSDSIFRKFVHTVVAQIDDRPMSARLREGEEGNSAIHCKHVAICQNLGVSNRNPVHKTDTSRLDKECRKEERGASCGAKTFQQVTTPTIGGSLVL